MSSGASYRPSPGSYAAKALEALQRQGKGMKGADLAREAGFDAKNVRQMLHALLANGLVVKMGFSRCMYFCLAEHTGPEFVPDGVAYTGPSDPPVSPARRVEPKAPQPVEQTAEEAPLSIVLWSDGDVVVHGGTQCDEPSSKLYNRAQAEQLVRFLAQPAVRIAP